MSQIIDYKVVNEYLDKISSAPLHHNQRLSQLLLRPELSLINLKKNIPLLKNELDKFSAESLEQVEIQLKYATYLEKEIEMSTKMNELENQIIPFTFNYDKILSISNEARQKFNKIKPQTLGQASRISGVNPTDIQILMVYMGR